MFELLRRGLRNRSFPLEPAITTNTAGKGLLMSTKNDLNMSFSVVKNLEKFPYKETFVRKNVCENQLFETCKHV